MPYCERCKSVLLIDECIQCVKNDWYIRTLTDINRLEEKLAGLDPNAASEDPQETLALLTHFLTQVQDIEGWNQGVCDVILADSHVSSDQAEKIRKLLQSMEPNRAKMAEMRWLLPSLRRLLLVQMNAPRSDPEE